jgi:hypothetical protein
MGQSFLAVAGNSVADPLLGADAMQSSWASRSTKMNQYATGSPQSRYPTSQKDDEPYPPDDEYEPMPQ